LGFICLAMRDNRYFAMLGFSSFDSWLENACPKSRSVVYAAMGALAELKDILPEDLKEIPHSTAHVLKKLPRVMRANPEIIRDAKRLTTKEFSRKVKREAPNLHLEDLVTRQFHFSETQEQVIDQAIAVVRKEYEDISEEMALELICVEFLQSQ
jgi:adenylosuccinate lyase